MQYNNSKCSPLSVGKLEEERPFGDPRVDERIEFKQG
jgi:hypothetical protein